MLGDVMATHQHQVPVGQTPVQVIGLSTKRSNGASIVRVWNEQWARKIEEEWQGHLEILRQCISELLINNQHLRVGADKPSRE